MALIEEFEKKGNWLFKHRSFIPLGLYAACMLIIIFDHSEVIDFQNIWWRVACIIVSLLGIMVRAITIGYVPEGTSGRNTKEGQVAESLNTKGIYSIVRHPLYLGNFLMWFGLILYTGVPYFIIGGIAFFWLYYERIMFAEEAFIKGKFGDDYMSWASKTPPFMPKFKLWESANMHFSLKNVLRREYNGFFATFLSFTLIAYMKNYFYYKEIEIDYFWLICLGAAFLIFITLRTLKKKTKVLNVDGR